MFRNLIFLTMAVGAATMAGWLSIDREGDRTTIQINKAEILGDTRRAIDRSRELLNEREQRLASRESGDFANQDYAQQPYPQQIYPPQTAERQYDYPADQYLQQRYATEQYPASQYPASRYTAPQYDQVQYRETGYQQQQSSGVYRGQANQAYQSDQNR